MEHNDGVIALLYVAAAVAVVVLVAGCAVQVALAPAPHLGLAVSVTACESSSYAEPLQAPDRRHGGAAPCRSD